MTCFPYCVFPENCLHQSSGGCWTSAGMRFCSATKFSVFCMGSGINTAAHAAARVSAPFKAETIGITPSVIARSGMPMFGRTSSARPVWLYRGTGSWHSGAKIIGTICGNAGYLHLQRNTDCPFGCAAME